LLVNGSHKVLVLCDPFSLWASCCCQLHLLYESPKQKTEILFTSNIWINEARLIKFTEILPLKSDLKTYKDVCHNRQ
jgi:hypothetical protein